MRVTPSRVSGNPVDSKGSTNPAADGSKTQREPATTPLRKVRRGEWMNGIMASAGAKDFCKEGSRCSSLLHAGSPDFKFSSLAKASVAATPALVMPLLNLSTQIQPPGKT